MPPHKKKSNGFASLLIKDRFVANKNERKKLTRNSITEYAGISMLNEKLTVENKMIYNSKENIDNNCDIALKYSELIQSLNYNLSIPPRVSYMAVEKGEYKAVECFIFNKWKYLKKDFIFERNLEIWRQFWITCERSDTIAQILDSRNPCAYFNEDVIKMYPEKEHVLLFNKTDLIKKSEDPIQKILAVRGSLQGISRIYSYSSMENVFDFNFSGTVGLIGYPNVGKSSTINLILKQKKVKVSSTPGKTKYIQTIETPNFTLLDCPGFVFPSHSKIQLILMGILNIDQISDVLKFEKSIVEYVGIDKLSKFYSIPEFEGDFLLAMCRHKGWIKTRCLKTIVKDFIAGKIKYN